MASVLGISPYGPDIFSKAIQTGKGVSDIIGQYYQTKERRAEAQRAEQRFPFELEKERVAQEFLPREKETGLQELLAKVGLTGAQTREAQARTGLYQSQAQQKDIFALYSKFLKGWENAIPGSHEQILYANALDHLMPMGGIGGGARGRGASGIMGVGAGGGHLSTAGAREAAAGELGATLNPFGSNRAQFHQASFPGPEGSGESVIVESPTPTAAKMAQVRDVSTAERDYLYPKQKHLTRHYRGGMGNIEFATDTMMIKNPRLARLFKYDVKAAEKRVQEHNLGQRFRTELSAIEAKGSTGAEPGIEVMQEFRKSTSPGAISDSLVGFLTPKRISVANDEKARKIMKKTTQAGIERERQGFARKTGTPIWERKPPELGYFAQRTPNYPQPKARKLPTGSQIISDIEPSGAIEAIGEEIPVQMVQVIRPDGKRGSIPEDQLAGALKAGFKRR